MKIINALVAITFIFPIAHAQGPFLAPVTDVSRITSTMEQSVLSAPPKAQNAPNLSNLPIDRVLVEIGRCESHNRQFNDDGSVLRGRVNPLDVGKYQINEKYHLEQSQKMGIDIYTEEGNEAYAVWLYKNQGTEPWLASKPCWEKSLVTNM